jgi:SNF2 family DNA or RNA helicase
MSLAVFGELTADGTHIALLPVADDDGVSASVGASRFKRLTAVHTLHEENGLRTGVILVPATWPTVVQLGFTFNGTPGCSWEPQGALNDWAAAEATWRTEPPAPLTQELPAGLKPRPYQVDGAARIAHAGKFLLLDDPGVGKTVTTIMGIEERRVRGHDVFPMVIIVPSWEVAYSWREHILRWAPAWGMPRLHRGASRVQGIGARNRHRYARDVFITTYATARKDAADDRGPLVRLAPATLVCDEVHWIRNEETAQTKAAKHIGKSATTFVGCSGTGIARNTGDISPPSWTSRKRAKQRYLTVIGDVAGYGEKITGLDPDMAEEFYATIEGQWGRYAKDDVLADLPRKIYSKLLIDIPDKPDDWRAAYDQMELDWLAELPGNDVDLEAMDTLTRLTRLSQLASSAADVRIEKTWDEDRQAWVAHQVITLRRPSWKAEALIRFLEERPDQPTAVFTESRQLAMITGEYCQEAGLRTGYIVGVGDGNEGHGRITTKTRKLAMENFQGGRLDVIVCTAGAGGTGITLTAANCCCLLQRSFQYDLGIQPEDRVHRIGAEIHDHVQIVDFVARDTVDQRRRDVLRDKAGMLGELVRDVRIVAGLLGGKR